ncbi:DNA polymerase III subunit gamma/tau [Microbacterium stercoris]|uniref:DNA polymerase III subunit gamma/tau n=1 Tax=Microbacterium stercoris TaxID=2820289 RepID=A0A939TQW4_9MICO|nr:DNA polymerase III subunit gamma/tau [Microbacterium stercoris]MBO3663885.1 DNA polymerase III subunit gamma/tau [Microbacterium stercoris]
MSSDDDALSWDGDEDRIDSPSPRVPASPPRGWRAVGKGSEAVPPADDDAAVQSAPADDDEAVQSAPAEADSGAPASLGNAALVSIGVIAGVYALYVVGWALGSFRLRDVQTAGGQVADVMFQAAMWLGMAAPIIWFFVTMLVTRGSALWRRFAGLALGILLLVPWPFVMMGMVGR